MLPNMEIARSGGADHYKIPSLVDGKHKIYTGKAIPMASVLIGRAEKEQRAEIRRELERLRAAN